MPSLRIVEDSDEMGNTIPSTREVFFAVELTALTNGGNPLSEMLVPSARFGLHFCSGIPFELPFSAKVQAVEKDEEHLKFRQEFGQKRGNLLYWKSGLGVPVQKEGFHEQVYSSFPVCAVSV